MIVIDASALAAYILKEEGFDNVLDYLRRYRVVSVDLVLEEVANAIMMALRRGRIGPEEAGRAFKALLPMPNTVIELYPQKDVLEEAFNIAIASKLTVYDSLYIALAKRVRGTLLTRDREQYKVAKALNIEVQLV